MHWHLERAFLKRFPLTCLRTWCGCRFRCLRVSLQKSWFLETNRKKHVIVQINFEHPVFLLCNKFSYLLGKYCKYCKYDMDSIAPFSCKNHKMAKKSLLTVVLCLAQCVVHTGCNWTLLQHSISHISSLGWTSAAPPGCMETHGHSVCIWSEDKLLDTWFSGASSVI